MKIVRLVLDRARRASLRRPGWVLDQTTTALDVFFEDISRSGCLIRSGLNLMPGTELNLSIPGIGTRRALVCRAELEFAGCQFDTPLDDAEIERALEARRPDERGIDQEADCPSSLLDFLAISEDMARRYRDTAPRSLFKTWIIVAGCVLSGVLLIYLVAFRD